MAGWGSKKKSQPEKEIEKYLVKQVEGLGGMCPKWNSPGTNGVPDRIVLMPDSIICFVEVKRPVGGKPSAIQLYREKQLAMYGHKVFFINTKEKVDTLVKSLMKGIIPDGV